MFGIMPDGTLCLEGEAAAWFYEFLINDCNLRGHDELAYRRLMKQIDEAERCDHEWLWRGQVVAEPVIWGECQRCGMVVLADDHGNSYRDAERE